METEILDLAFYRYASEQQPRQPLARDIDRHIGARLRQRRVLNGLSTRAMADLIGVTCKQADKYENGADRIAAGRLYKVARVLGVEVGYFYEGLQSAPPLEHSSQQRLFLEFTRTFRSIRKRKHQEAICLLTRILAAGENGCDIDGWELGKAPEARSGASRVQGANY